MTISISNTSITGGLSNLTAAGNISSIKSQIQMIQGYNQANVWTGLTPISLGDCSTEKINSYVSKYTIFDLKQDVIALAVTNARLKALDGSFHKLTDQVLFEKMTSNDKELSIKIREYYKKKFTYLTLASSQRSNYREDLFKLINDDGKKIPENYFGIAWYLPYFYEYDLQRDEIKSQVMIKGAKEKIYKLKNIVNDFTITPISRLRRKTKRTDCYEYWFKTVDDFAFMVSAKVDNNLLSLIQYVFNQKIPMVISGKVTCKQIDNFEYFSSTNWTLTKI
jgi:hypothetical protein